ncbi:hypothetical protein KKC63_03320 [Patescibacteria group bacterium]|nr:hypothetical protein [Patescibacteria group bacterium]MBU4023422.1 hypothetical protein [Patescibacteria group bacterium]
MEIIGHKRQSQYLKQSAENNRLAHAYLFYGPSKIGKRTFAIEFAKSLQKPEERLANFSMLEPIKGEEEDNKRESIHILQIRELKSKLSLSSASDGYKIAIIDNAQAMTFDAQGAMLKLLEEPKGKSLIILIAELKDQLLSTITSRCQLIRFSTLSKQDIGQFLDSKDLDDSDKKMALWLSFGKMGRVIDYLDKKEERAIQKNKIKEIRELIGAPIYEKFALAEKLSKNRNELLPSLEVWLHYFREVLLKKLKKEKIKKEYSFNDLKEIINAVERTKYVLTQTNVNPRLALENLLLKI